MTHNDLMIPPNFPVLLPWVLNCCLPTTETLLLWPCLAVADCCTFSPGTTFHPALSAMLDVLLGHLPGMDLCHS